ncbi:hypothetical protein CKF74_13680 [Corynebacterium striatum]|nr:hypothetical protein CKF74_13680 [Corynebacterium striatum]
MSRYSEQFKRDAVALYENNEDLSLHAASAELGVNRSSLFSWLQQYGTGKRGPFTSRGFSRAWSQSFLAFLLASAVRHRQTCPH